MGVNEPAAAGDSTARRQRRFRGNSAIPTLLLTAVAPLAIALVSLALSIYTYLEATRAPEIWLSAPDVVRVASGERAWFYVQPRLVSAARNDRVAIVSGLRLEVAGPDDGRTAAFVWDEQGTWQYDPVGQGLTWMYLADAAPLVVGPSSPQLPICLFEGPPDWRWQEGSYRVNIVAELGQDADPLRATFEATLPAETVEQIDSQPGRWVGIRTRVDG